MQLHPRGGRSLSVIPGGLAMHPIPFRFLSFIALVSGIASQMTSDVSAESHRSSASSPSLHPYQHLQQQQQQQQHRSHGISILRSSQTGEASAVNALESQRAEGHRAIHSDSILEMINREQVGRILARKMEEERQGEGVQKENRVGEGRKGGRMPWKEGKKDGKKGREDGQRRPRNKKLMGRKNPEGHQKERNGRHRVSLSQLSKRINDSSLMDFPIPNPPIPSSPDPFPALEHESGDKILKSSKDALVVTRREYLRRDWCRTEPLVQRVKVDGCLSKTLINGFCYGQCNSFYIPRSPSEQSSLSSTFQRPNRLKSLSASSASSIPILYTPAFKSCAFCKPKEITWTTLTLRCPQLKPAQLMLRRRVERIKQCKCITEVFN